MANKSATKSPQHASLLSKENRARREHGDYLESPAKMARAFEEGLERTRAMLAAQREELARLARMRR
jgi:hypothetical protein